MHSPSTSAIDASDSRLKSSDRGCFLDGLAALPYHERISCFLRGSARHRVAGGVSVLDFRPLYTVTLHDLQRKLAGIIREVEREDFTDEQLISTRATLHEYTNALRDFEFIHANRWSTQFIKDIAASRIDNGVGSKLQGAIIEDLDFVNPDDSLSLFCDADLLGSFEPKLMQHSSALGLSLGTTREQASASEERKAQFAIACKRFAFALVGGSIIIVPMLILLVGTVEKKILAVVPFSIVLFSVGVAIFAKTDPVNLLAATAAYAAVLAALIKP